MKFCYLTALALASGSHAFSPQLTPTTTRLSVSELQAHRPEGWMGPAAAAVAGWTLAAQVAFAAAPLPLTSSDLPAPTMDTSSTVVVAGSLDTMDFSMPSYSDATKSGEVKPSSSGSAPSFNPFGDFDFGVNKGDDSAAPVEPAAPAVDTKAEAKAAAEAKKAEEKAAAEAKKAEKEARRAAEMEKIKEAAERAKQRKEEESAAASSSTPSTPEVSIPSFSAPEVPDIKLPDFKAPDIKVPDFKAPSFDFKAPDIKTPEFKAPEVGTSDFKAPEFKAPDIKVPDFKAPDIKVPDFKAPDMPKFAMPSAPKIPSFDAPKSSSGGYDFESYSSSSPSSVAVDDVEPQEVRDDRAKDAASVFAGADKDAKEVERQARELRNIANEKKKIAKQLKDEACATRFGGKVLCIRPLNSGY